MIEGDEYNAAYFDRGAKFLHYRPETLILTSVEHDHADLYPTPESLLAAYSRLIALVPESGLIVACGDSAEIRQLAEAARAPVVFYGEHATNAVRLLGVPEADSAGVRFRLREESGDDACGDDAGVGCPQRRQRLGGLGGGTARTGSRPAELAGALARFRGVKRRQELLADHRGIVVIDDFAHHPTAVEKTLASMRMRFPGRRLLACFEPRSLTAGRAFLLAGYARAFALADRAYFAPIFHRDRLAPEDRLDLAALAASLAGAGTPCVLAEDLEALVRPGARRSEGRRRRADDVVRIVRWTAPPPRRRGPRQRIVRISTGGERSASSG